MELKDFYYELPNELIAQTPLSDRTASRLMLINKEKRSISHSVFKDIINHLNKGDLLVLNDTRVIPARLYGIKEDTGAKIEFLLLDRKNDDDWEILVKPGKKALVGTKIKFGDGLLTAEIIETLEDGNRIARFFYEGIFEEVLDKLGEMPLPPYIKEKLTDKERYQTVYSKYEGSAAAPTAGLHFTTELLEEIRNKGVNTAFVTLHVGLGTFRQVKVEKIEEHKMHSEFYIINEETAKLINETKARGGRIISVGTTSVRVLETVADKDGFVNAQSGYTNIFIYPGYKFKLVNAIITNFHLPESTLIMLVSAFSDKELILKAYETAVNEKYRFFSFGDAMFIE